METNFTQFVTEIHTAVLLGNSLPSPDSADSQRTLNAIQGIRKSVLSEMEQIAVSRDLTVEEADAACSLWDLLLRMHLDEKKLVAARKEFDALPLSAPVN